MQLFDTSLYSQNQQQSADYPIPQPNWELIQTQERAIEVIESLMGSDSPSPLGIDLETTGLHPQDNSKGEYPRIRLLQIAPTPDFCYILDLFYLDVGQLSLNQLFRERRKVAHNFKFEALWLKSIGVEVRAPLFCSFLAAQLIENGKHEKNNNGNKESPYSLRSVARKYAQKAIPKEQQRSDWSKLQLSKEQLEYAARDAAILLEIREAQLEPLKSNGLIKVAQLEFRAVLAFAQLEYEGVLLDWERLEGIRQGAIAKLEPARQEFLKALDSEIGLEKDIFGGYAFNPRSNEQLLAAFQRAGIPVRDVRKESLEPLASDYPLIERYLSYHRIETQIADIEKYYPSKARKHIPWDSATGKIFPGYWQIGTISGRASSKEPNIQNPPKGEFRECVIPESGKRFVVGDYSQAHPRIVAKVSCDAAFTQVFQNGECCYSYEASTLTGKPIEQIKREHKEKTSNDRNDAKPVVLGFIYGLSPGGYVRQVQGKHTEAFARKARNQFFKTHPEVGNWHEQIQRKLDISAIATTQSGRIVELRGRNRRFNFAVNFPVLGTEADMMKSAMGFLVEEFDKLPYKVSLKIMIHDEIVVECPCGKEEEVSQILDRVMREASDLLISPIPAKVDIESGDSWVKP